MKTITHAVLPAVLLAVLTTAMTLSAISFWEVREYRRLLNTVSDQALSTAELFHKERHALAFTNQWSDLRR